MLTQAVASASAGEFTRTLTPEALQATGLVKLTPKELAALEAQIESYKSGTTKPATSTAAATTSVPTVTADPAASSQAKAVPEARSSGILPDWVGALITLKRAENSPSKPQALESRIVGQFSGWSGRTEFKLENGQVWTQSNNDSYRYTPPLTNPKVRIFPATFGSFWMEIEGVGQPCRVRPLRLE